MPDPDSEDDGGADVSAGRLYVVDRARPSWAEVDAEQRERLGLPAGAEGRR
jgi:hypothetical protein